jgi:hypothetical protein
MLKQWLLVAFLICSGAHASNLVLTKSTPEQARTYYAELFLKLDDGSFTERFKPAQKESLREKTVLMREALQEIKAWEDISKEQQTKLDKVHEQVNDLVDTASDAKVCKRERRTGTNLMKTVCRSREQVEEERRRSRNALLDIQGKH